MDGQKTDILRKKSRSVAILFSLPRSLDVPTGLIGGTLLIDLYWMSFKISRTFCISRYRYRRPVLGRGFVGFAAIA
jgi:hypothetical protein